MKFFKFLILPIFLLAFFQVSAPVNAQTVCPQYAAKCSDGSYVSPTGPNCELTKCPAGSTLVQNAPILKKTADQTAALKQSTANLASMSALKQARKDALSDLKVQACQARQANIAKRSDQMVKRATNQQDVFVKIAQRVEEFYQTKLVPQGKIVANYDALVADMTTKSAALAPLIAKAQTDATSFSCDKDHPSEQVLTFNQDMKAVIAALETYRMSVRNLIVAVKGVVGTENSATNSAKPVTAQ